MEEKSTTTKQEFETKFCKECGQKIAKKAIICPYCGCQVEAMEKTTQKEPSNIVIQNNNSQVNTTMMGTYAKNKWVALLLCVFLGALGGHKFYEGKVGMGILYIFTLGFCGLGVFIDFFTILCKPNPYYV